MGLSAIHPALAHEPTGTDGDGGLDDVESLAERVLRRIEQGADTMLLVIAHPHPFNAGLTQRVAKGHDGADADDAHNGNRHDQLPRQAGKEDHVETGRRHQQTGTEVRLLDDEPDRNRQQQTGEDEFTPADAPLTLLKEPRQHQRHRNLHQLRGLDAGDADIEPALGAFRHLAKQCHADQQHDAHQIKRQGERQQALARQPGRKPHHADRHRHVRHLRIESLGRGARHQHEGIAEECRKNQHQHRIDRAQKGLQQPQGVEAVIAQSALSTASTSSGAGWLGRLPNR